MKNKTQKIAKFKVGERICYHIPHAMYVTYAVVESVSIGLDLSFIDYKVSGESISIPESRISKLDKKDNIYFKTSSRGVS